MREKDNRIVDSEKLLPRDDVASKSAHKIDGLIPICFFFFINSSTLSECNYIHLPWVLSKFVILLKYY